LYIYDMSIKQIYGLRIGIGFLVFLFFKITSENVLEWQPFTFYSMFFTVAVVLIIFQIIDLVGRKLIKKYKSRLNSNRVLFRFYIANCLATAPFVLLASIIHVTVFAPYLTCEGCERPTQGLTQTVAQGLVLSWLIISAKTFMIYVEYSRRSESEKSIIQQELALSKFESLKDQIQPHFLFNSFSVLSSIIEDDPKLAVEFVSKLSKIYRYVLDNRSQLVVLKTELEYLEHYVFLLKTRHGESIKVNIDFEDPASFLPILSLKMLVENALKHNYFSKEQPLMIDVFSEESKFLVVRNGLNKRIVHRESTKFGLKNIQKRYELLVEKDIEVLDDGAYFTVKLPIIMHAGETKL
jgi:sensor histidine kinase YesM